MATPRFTSRKERLYIWLIRFLFAGGLLALVYFLSWWLDNQRWRSPLLLLVLASALVYSLVQMVANWWLYLVARPPQPAPPRPAGLTVDVFIPAWSEKLELIEQTLSAACKMRGDHHTWLLDDGDDPRLAELAMRLGAGYLTRPDRKDFKAGNINAALARTNGDILVIFDIDHTPHPDFLERTLGHFQDPRIGFVQVMLSFSNFEQSWVARASTETSLDYYNPTSLGLDYYRSVTLMGSNALLRRTALECIGGYRPGLAEDLATSIALHAAGWDSAYVAEPLAPGLAPPDLTAWFVQQLKWARGVFELLLTAYPGNFKRLNNGQRFSYAVRMTKYWIGPAVAVHLFSTIAILIFEDQATRDAFHSYLLHLSPLILCDMALRAVALHTWRHPSVRGLSFFSAVVLIYSSWPIYLLAWGMALFRTPLSFRPTPKTRSGRVNLLWLLPQTLMFLLLLAGLVYTVLVKGHPFSLLLSFAVLQAALQLLLLYPSILSKSHPADLAKASWRGAIPEEKRHLATAILIYDLDHLPADLSGLQGAERALIYLRVDGQIGAQISVSVTAGRVEQAALQQALRTVDRKVLERLRWEAAFRQEDPLIKATLPQVSVAVCTRDRPQDLRRCLASLAALPDDGQEILCIDSASSSDETRQVAAEFPGVHYLRCDQPGLDRARNLALSAAAYPIVAFCDDDAVVDPGWLRALRRNFLHPHVQCVTGLTLPLELDTPAQETFERMSSFGRGFARREFHFYNHDPLMGVQTGAGANMAVRKSVTAILGVFDEALDAGTPTRSGGDCEFFSRLLSRGFVIVYEPAALSWHRHRHTWPELTDTVYGYGVGIFAMWTRQLVQDHEARVLWLIFWVLFLDWVPALLRSLLRRPGSIPINLLLAQLRGYLRGPSAYRESRRRLMAGPISTTLVKHHAP
jgi:cellulose synthase/poly-beta-1,6-N-acetylglucosamine synthase-like glycosyltransferase